MAHQQQSLCRSSDRSLSQSASAPASDLRDADRLCTFAPKNITAASSMTPIMTACAIEVPAQNLFHLSQTGFEPSNTPGGGNQNYCKSAQAVTINAWKHNMHMIHTWHIEMQALMHMAPLPNCMFCHEQTVSHGSSH